MTSTLANTIELSPPARAPDRNKSAIINQNFIGFAFESWSMTDYAGTVNSEKNKELSANLISTFTDKTGSPVQLRVGGTSMDNVTYDPNQKVAILPENRPELTIPSTFGPSWLDSLKQFDNVKWTLQVPLAKHKNGDTQNTVEFSNAMLQAIGGMANLEAMEIGNEPDLYESQGFRDKGYGPNEYAAEWKKFAEAVVDGTAVQPGQHFQACDLANRVDLRPRWSIEKLFNEHINEKGWIKSVSGHYYQDDETHDIQKSLMDHNLTENLLDKFSPGIAFLNKTPSPPLPFTLGEVGDLLGSGPLSAGLGSALWAVDWCLTSMLKGVARINFQLGTGFQFAAWLIYSDRLGPDVRGTFYGAAFVADFIGKGGGFRVVGLDQHQNPKITAYGGYHNDRLEKVVIVNLDLYNSGSGERPSEGVRLNVPDGVKSVVVHKLTGAGGETQNEMRWADNVWTAESRGKPVKKYNDTQEYKVEGKVVNLKVQSSEALFVRFRR